MTISNLSSFQLSIIFHYLPIEDKLALKKVNQRWKLLIEEEGSKLFSKEFLRLKASKDTFIRTRYLLEAAKKERSALETFVNAPENQLNFLNCVWSLIDVYSLSSASYRQLILKVCDKRVLLKKLTRDIASLTQTNQLELQNYHSSKRLL